MTEAAVAPHRPLPRKPVKQGMIHLTRLNHISLVLNAELIESIEVTPDTLISLTTGQKLVVLESADEVVRRVVEYRRAIFSGLLQCYRRGSKVTQMPEKTQTISSSSPATALTWRPLEG